MSSACLKYLLDSAYCHFVLKRGFPPPPARAAEIAAIHSRLQAEEYSRIYPPYQWDRESGAWALHHGLRNCTAAVRAFLADRWMIDVGAGCGDSLLVLEKYSRLGVVAYEVDDQMVRITTAYAKQIAGKNCSVFKRGLGERAAMRGTMEMASLDEEVARMGIRVGFIKIDIEGDELGVLRGAVKTLKEQKPILSISIYHNIECIDLPQWVEEQIGGYEFTWCFLGTHMVNFYELTMMAFPVGLQFLE
jgi:hypothetical protein